MSVNHPVWICPICKSYRIYTSNDGWHSSSGEYVEPMEPDDVEKITSCDGYDIMFKIASEGVPKNGFKYICFLSPTYEIWIPFRKFNASAIYDQKDKFGTLSIDMGHGSEMDIKIDNFDHWNFIVDTLSIESIIFDENNLEE